MVVLVAADALTAEATAAVSPQGRLLPSSSSPPPGREKENGRHRAAEGNDNIGVGDFVPGGHPSLLSLPLTNAIPSGNVGAIRPGLL